MNQPIIKKLEDRITRLKQEISNLEKERSQCSKRASQIQVMVIGLTGEKNATEEIINELKEK